MPTIIKSTGSFIPDRVISEDDFINSSFYNEKYDLIKDDNKKIIKKLEKITGINERRYAREDQVSSDLGLIASQRAIEKGNINKEKITAVIYCHNYGDILHNHEQSDTVPSLAARLKNKLGILNPNCVAFDVLAGCPGWIQGVIIADKFIKTNKDELVLVIGSETLSRVVDPHDRDTMIYADGAGATILGYEEGGEEGIKSIAAQSFTELEAYFINFGTSYNKEYKPLTKYIKMQGRKIYEFAITKVPEAMKSCLDASGYTIDQLDKILIHQANEKMDEVIVKKFYELYNVDEVPTDIMPMSISFLGNSSVATIPTLLDIILQNQLPPHQIKKGDVLLFASVGAGMNINAFVYKY